MRLYFRHAEKAYANGHNTDYKYDPPLKDSAYEDIKRYAAYLLKLYGAPTAIICSPYLRTRQTAEALNACLDEGVQIYYDPLLSEYLGHHRDKELDVYPETKIYNPPHPETWKDLEKRSIDHYNSFSHYDECPEVFWFVTHGTVLSCISKHIGKMYKNPPTLGGFCIRLACFSSRQSEPVVEAKRFYTALTTQQERALKPKRRRP